MTKITRTYDPEEYKLVPLKLPYRSRLAMAIKLDLSDQRDKEKLEAVWEGAVRASFDQCGEEPDPQRIPTLDEATRFIQSNPETTARILSGLKP